MATNRSIGYRFASSSLNISALTDLLQLSSFRAACRVAATGPIDLATDLEAGDTVDGVVLVAGDRVLVPVQATASENGIYIASASGAASRATDFDEDAEVISGAYTIINEGATHTKDFFVLVTGDPITVGVTDQEWVALPPFPGSSAPVTFDYLLDLGTGTTEAIQVAAVDAAAAAVADVITDKGHAVIAIKGEITWITAATVPASHDNITWFKTGLTIKFPVGMTTGIAATAYFRGTKTSIIGSVGRILIEEDTATVTERTIWEGSANAICENWFVDVVGASSNVYPFAAFVTTGKESSISGITADPDSAINNRTYLISLNGEKSSASDCKSGFKIDGTGLDLSMINCKNFRNITVEVGADFAQLIGVSVVVGSTATFSILADDVQVTNSLFGWSNTIPGNRCLMTNLSNSTTNGLNISGADCKLLNMNASNVTSTMTILGSGFEGVNLDVKALVIIASRTKLSNTRFGGRIFTFGEDLNLELEFIGTTITSFNFSGFTGASRLVILWTGQADGTSISPINEWFNGFGTGTDVTIHMRLDGVPHSLTSTLFMAGVFGDYADGQTIAFTDDMQTITIELDTNASVTGGNIAADISGAATLADIQAAITLALNNSDSALELDSGFVLTAKRFLAMEYSDTSGSGDSTSIVDATSIPITITRGISGISRLPSLQNCTDCDITIYTNSGSGVLGDNVVAAILPSFVGGSVTVNVSEELAADNPIIVCLATGVQYNIVNRIGETQIGWEWGATGTVDFSGGGGTDSIDSITVDGVPITSGAEAFDTNLDTTVQNVVDNINAFTSTPNYIAVVFPGDTSRILIREVVAVGGPLAVVGNVTDNGGGLAVNAALTFDLGGGADFGVDKSMFRVTGDVLHYADSVNKSNDNLVDALLVAATNPVTGNQAGNDHRGTT